MKKELSKWFLDVSKYITTAFLISTFLGGINERWLVYVISIAAIIVTMLIGLWLLNNKEKKEN
jgi:biotin transporter BioY